MKYRKLRNWSARQVRRVSAWAWQDELDNRYTHLEVAQWLSFYHGRYRELTLTEFVAVQRQLTASTSH